MSKLGEFIRQRRVWVLGILAVFVLLGGGYFFLVPKEETVTARTAKAVRGDLVVSFTTNGKIQPVVGADLVVTSDGRVAEILAQEGSFVKKGDSIIRLDNPDVERLYQEAKLQYEQAQKDFGRDEYLFNNGALTRYEYDLSRTRFESARSTYRNLRDKLYLSAPLSGKLYALYPKIGEPLRMGQKVASLGDTSRLEAKVFVDEPDVGSISIGLPVKITTDAQPELVWKGRIVKIPSVLVPEGSRTVAEVTCSIESDQKKLIPNMNIDVEIIQKEEKSALKVPVEAVYREEGKSFVYLIAQGKLVKTPVQVSIANNTESSIVSGVKEGDEVVSDPEAKVKDGAKVMRKTVK